MTFSDLGRSDEAEARRLLNIAFETIPVGESVAGHAALGGELLRSVRRQERNGRWMRGATGARAGGLLAAGTGRRAVMVAAGCVAVIATVATVVALQPGTGPATRPPTQAAAPVKVNLGGVGAAVQTTSAPVTATLTAETKTTAASVLDQAARASGSGNVPLVNGWPAAPYWHTLWQTTNSDCPGHVTTTNNWLGEDGTDVAGDHYAGPTSSDPASSCFSPRGTLPGGYYTVGGDTDGDFIGGRQYSWAQFAALPTDPAKLWPILEADSNVGEAPDNGGLYWTTQTIIRTLESDPVSPAMRVALYKVMEKFPGVKVTGTYTDSLGRTGTAISFTAPRYGSTTVVIDSSTGQVLAQLAAAQPVPPGCVRATVGGSKGASAGGSKGATCGVGGAAVEVFISAGPARTMPLHTAKLVMPSLVGDTFAKAQHVLTQLGIETCTIIGTKAPAGMPTGTVIAQSPAAGTTVTQLEEPTLTIRP